MPHIGCNKHRQSAWGKKNLSIFSNKYPIKIHELKLIQYNVTSYFMLQKFFKNKNVSKKLKLRLKNTIIDKVLTHSLPAI